MTENLESNEWDKRTVEKMEAYYIRLAVKYAALMERGKIGKAKTIAAKIEAIDVKLFNYECFDSMEQYLLYDGDVPESLK